MKIGHIVASNEVMVDGKQIGYLYREAPRDDLDSGWRVFSGEETDDYLEESGNFALYNAATVLECSPIIRALLGFDFPVEFEYNQDAGQFVRLDE